MKRVVAVDIAKAICIIFVVTCHYFPANSPYWYVVLYNIVSYFHMPLFMFASGYIYLQTKRDMSYFEFFKSKIRRLIIPYFTASVLVITIKLLSQNVAYVEKPVTFHSYIAILYSPSAAVFFWFIWVLFIIFLIVPLFRTKKSRLILFAVTCILRFLPVTFPSIFCLHYVKIMSVFFFLGVIIADYKNLLQVALKTPAFIVYLLFAGLFSFRFFFVEPSVLDAEFRWVYVIIDLLIQCLGIFSICKFSIWISHLDIRNYNWLLGVAANSYIIYLFHTTFMGFFKAILHRVTGFHETDNYLIFTAVAFLYVTVGVLLPMLLNKWFLQKSKVLCFLFGLKYNVIKPTDQ